ncbi:MAG: hypothetical protein R3194_01810 [Limnobacter sp.]|nr:hypothetical protein [Limnobacter sp.]
MDTLLGMDQFFPPQDALRHQIAMSAAKMIAEEGYDYPSARLKAIKQSGASKKIKREQQPSDQEIENEVRAYQSLYQSDTQPGELRAMRQEALELMQQIQEFEPIVFGPVVNGTGNKMSDIQLVAFSDDPKEIDYWLLNKDIAFDACEDALLAGKTFNAVGFKWRQYWVQLGSATPRDRRGLLKNSQRAGVPFQTDTSGLIKLINETHNQT